MAQITLRTGPTGKGSPLTLEEVDNNFNNLNVEIGQKLDITAYTPADVLAKIELVDGVNSGLDADLVRGLNSSPTVPTTTDYKASVVTRDSTGNFAGVTISATQFVGPLTGNVTGNLTGNADTATKLATARNINGVAFDGTESIQVRDDNKVLKAGDTMTGDLTLSYTVDPVSSDAKLAVNKEYVDKYGVPKGTIVMWSGTSLPSNMVGIWGLCDGTIQNGMQTPDLRNMFILGATTFAGVGGTGGGSSATTSTAGSHNHGGSVAATALDTSHMPSHSHQFYDVFAVQDDVGNGNYTLSGGVPQYAGMAGSAGSNNKLVDADGNSVTWSYYLSSEQGEDQDQAAFAFKNVTLNTGAAGPATHTHTIATDGTHQHTVPNTLPPYYTLAYIIKLI